MHSLINQETVNSIETTGKTNPNLPDRIDILEAHSLPYDARADIAVISGCQILSSLPHVLSSLSHILSHGGLSHTFLSKEYCCGNYLYRPAIKARNDDAMAECRSLSKKYVEKNIQAAKSLGAKQMVIFCSPCYPIYRHAAPDEDIVFYPVVIRRAMGTHRYKSNIDYYAGCYKLHRRFSPVPMDLKSTEQVFKQISNLTVNQISAPECCFKPDGLKHMLDSIKTRLMIHICTGCYGQARLNLSQDHETEVLMLPEFVERVINQDTF